MPTRTTGGRKLAEFLRKAKAAASKSKGVDVGFFKSARYPDGTQVAAVAAFNEFGVPSQGIPERPFFRNAIAGAEREIMPILKAGIDPKTMELDDRTAGHVGEVMKARIQASIRTLKEPPNAPSTIRTKGSSQPLVDTAHMKNSVTYEVTDPGAGST